MSKLSKEEIQKLNQYIFNYWKKITFHTHWKDIKKWIKWSDWSLINLPHRYIIPSPTQFPEMFYWDSYFTIQGLKVHRLNELAKSMVDNCLYLVAKKGFVPNANRTFYLTRSQPPFLSQIVLEVYGLFKDIKWLEKAYYMLIKEYEGYWTKEPHLLKEFGLSRFYDLSGKDHEAENESGWDTTPRFDHRCSQILPVDLNCNLYQYEVDLASMAKILKLGRGKPARWTRLAKKRKELINKYFWNETLGLFFDYDSAKKTQLAYKTLAAFMPMWCNLATRGQAEKLTKNLDLFLQPGGLATCDYNYHEYDHQWNYPNGWAPLQYLVIKGLDNYGYKKEAKEIAGRWVEMVIKVFEKDKVIWEKYDVVTKEKGFDDYRYKTPPGFGWTNAITVWLMDYLGYEVKK
ncbi:alpha,alpha-trehalase [Patescibacteria group bacterium]|nr:alpha,alpha-trehalase [Patescibacteria group bacterium]